MNQQLKLRNTIKYPTSIIVNGVTNLGMEIADSLLEQGGYVIFIDTYNEQNLAKILAKFGDASLVSFIDYAAIPHLEEDLRRLDYVFYLAHEGIGESEEASISTQTFLKYSNYLDTTLSLTKQFEAKLVLTTSIRSHLKLMDRLDIEVNYGKDAVEKHPVYTDMEVERYAESLVLEYVSKVSLDAKVVRLGEIIGDGMDFSKQTTFTRLVISAVVGEDLVLKNDGLESEWYVHLLDAAYGIVRAQFTRNIKGEVYSLAYENAVSDLSLAYRLQEIEPNSKEIKFEQEDRTVAPLKLHKPSANLTRIGWRPKVEFVQAVGESVAAAKALALQGKDLAHQLPEGGVLGKLKTFLGPTRAELPEPEVESGPVYRLIAERRQQERARQESMHAADKSVKYKHNKRQLTSAERFNKWVYRTFFDTRTNFSMLRNVTPLEFFSGLAIIALLLFVYFAYFSPAVVIARNIILTESKLTELKNAYSQGDFKQVEVVAGSLKAMFQETSKSLEAFEGVAGLLAADKALVDAFEILDLYSNYTGSLANIAHATAPIQDYLGAYSSNITYRPSSENYLSTASGTDYSVYLDDLNSRRVFAELGEKELARTKRELLAFKPEAFPNQISAYFGGVNTKLLELDGMVNYAPISKYAPDLLGAKFPITYLIFLLDNSRPMPLGGQISAYALVSIQNGSISDVRIQPIDEFTPNLSRLPAHIKSTINNSLYTPLTTFKVTDLALISDPEVFAGVAKDLWQDSFGLDIDMVGTINLEALANGLDVTGDLTLEGQTVNKLSLLGVLASLQTENPTSQRRNDLSAQLLALMIQDTFGDLKANLIPMLNSLAKSGDRKDLVLARNDLGFNQVIEDNGLFGNVASTTDLPITIGFVSDTNVISPTRFPTFTENVEVDIARDSSMAARVLVKFPGISNVDQIVLCVPLAAKQVEVSGVSFTRVADNRNNNQKCSAVDVVSETEIAFEWDTIQFESSSDPEYNLSIGQVKPSGVQVEYSIEISLASSLTFSDIRPLLTSIGGKIALSESLLKDQIIELVVTKQ